MVVKDTAFSPRLAATFDPKGDGEWTANASYAKYVAAIANGVGDSGSAGGQPGHDRLRLPRPRRQHGQPGEPGAAADALSTLFDWFNANGGTDRPDPRHARPSPASPPASATVSPPRTSQEFTLGVTRRLGSRGMVRVDGVYREFSDFYGFDLDTTTGTGDRPVRPACSTSAITVNTDDVERKYKGLNFQVSYRPHDRLNLGGNYTLSNAYGNFNGETGPTGPDLVDPDATPSTSTRPGAAARSPRLAAASGGGPSATCSSTSATEPAAGSSGTCRCPTSRAGRAQLAADLQQRLALRRGGLRSTPRPYVTNPGYVNAPSSVDYYFTARDAFRMASLHRVDLSLNYAQRLGIKKSEIFFRGTVLNVFNRDELTNFAGGALPGRPDRLRHGGCINTTVQHEPNASALARVQPVHGHAGRGVNWRRARRSASPRAASRTRRRGPTSSRWACGSEPSAAPRPPSRPGRSAPGLAPGAVVISTADARRGPPRRDPHRLQGHGRDLPRPRVGIGGDHRLDRGPALVPAPLREQQGGELRRGPRGCPEIAATSRR